MLKSLSPGCTVIEILVAIALFGIGILALASSSAVVVRRLHTAHANSSASIVASSRFAHVAASRCGAASSGSATHQTGFTESWSATPLDAGHSRVSVQIMYARTGKLAQFESVVACR